MPWYIIYLARQPEDSSNLSVSANDYVTKIVALNFTREQGGYFLCLSFLTRVIIATIIITKVNKSLYVMYISTTPFARLETDGMTALPAAWVSILYCQCFS